MLLLVSAMPCAGCARQQKPERRGANDEALFGPSSMRLHPTFTQVKDWSGDGAPDGIEAVVELQDQFNEPTRATGRVIFELFAYRREFPDPRGERLTNPWIVSLATREDQDQRWNRAIRAYSFDLAFAEVQAGRTYVLAATFEAENGRLFDRLFLGPEQQE